MALQIDTPPKSWSPPGENQGFPYPPLDRKRFDIRLLRLHPRVSGRPIECQLFTLSLSPVPPEFSALSYTWGAPPVARQIFINGFPFTVRDGLFEFLQIYTKYIKKSTLLWVDAICIDQSSTLERNHQVGLMRQIYSSAAIVHVWLGGLHAEDREIVWLLKEMEQVATRPGPREFSDLKDIDSYSKRIINAHAQLTRRPYFHRVWIVQEVVLASRIDVWIGKHSLLWQSWRDFIRFYLQSYRHPTDTNYTEEYPESVWDQLEQLRDEREKQPSEIVHLGQLVSKFGHQRCADPHDRIYALLSLVSPPLPDFPIKYHDSLTHVFKHAYNAISDRDFRTIANLVGCLRLERELLHTCTPCQQTSLRVSFSRDAFIQGDCHPSARAGWNIFPLPKKLIMVAPSSRSADEGIASLTPSTKLNVSDRVFILARFEIGRGGVEICLAVAGDEAAEKVPKPCISVWRPKVFFSDLPQPTQVLLHYCLISALIEDPACQWTVRTTTTDPAFPVLFLQAPMTTMIRWMLAVKRIESLSTFTSHTAVILDLEKRGLVTPQQSKLCQEHSKRFDEIETE